MLRTNSRGFNLFSALVAAVLFLAGVMLVQTMVATEDRVSGQIFSMEENFSLSDAANLTRSDSLQTFNYHFREKLEEYLTANKFPILYRNIKGETNYGPGSDWEDVVGEFEAQVLLVREGDDRFDSVLNYVSGKIISDFKPGAYGRYYVSLDVSDHTQAKETTTEILMKSLETARSDGKPFLEVVECDRDKYPKCRLGTFYFNIPLDNIGDEDYERLPRIVVKDIITAEEIKIAILPRTNLRVYIPLRFFKAVHRALLDYSPALSNNHSQFSDYLLGYCERNNCGTRNSPMVPASGDRAQPCALSKTELGANEPLTSAPSTGLSEYPVYGTRAGVLGIQASVIEEVCRSGYNSASPSTNPDFINIDLEDPDEQGLEPTGTDTPIQRHIPNCPFSGISVTGQPFATKEVVITGGTSTDNRLYCSYVSEIAATVEFRETNTAYTVKGTENTYRITITDTDFPAHSMPINKCKTGTTPTGSAAGSCSVYTGS